MSRPPKPESKNWTRLWWRARQCTQDKYLGGGGELRLMHGKDEEGGQIQMLMKTMARFLIPTLAGLAFREIDDGRQGWS